jgi:hypothetical protein
MLVHIMIGMSMTVPSMHQQMQQGAQEEQQGQGTQAVPARSETTPSSASGMNH